VSAGGTSLRVAVLERGALVAVCVLSAGRVCGDRKVDLPSPVGLGVRAKPATNRTTRTSTDPVLFVKATTGIEPV
jgi:hypothetical protein